MNRRRWLESAECLSLFGLVIGSLAAVISGQLAYVYVPLSLTICLNLVNHSEFERLTQHKQQLLRELQLQRQEFTDFKLKSISADIAKLQEQYASLQQALLTLNYRVELLTQESAQDENLLESDPDDEDIDDLLDTLDTLD